MRPYTKVARAEAEDRTRTALLDAAEAAFLGDGWDKASLGTLAATAGVTKPTLLRHFGSKQGLLEQAYRRGFARVRDQRFATPVGDVAGAVDNLLDHYEEHGDEALKIGAMGGDEPIAGLVRNAKQTHYEWVDHAFGAWLDRLGGAERIRVRAALISLCDVQTWAIMRRDLGLAHRDARAALVLAIERILEEDA
ncbi:MAG TPA: TetR/AcrR family transcriptional regulator [Solirubrobacteraceae bacterium]